MRYHISISLEEGGKVKIMKWLLVLICLTGGVLFYGFGIEPYLLVTHAYQLIQSEGGTSLRIVQISDIQLSEHYDTSRLERIVEKVNANEPDVIIFSGDLFENYAEYGSRPEVLEEVGSLLGRMEARYAKLAIYGNRDYGGGAESIYTDLMHQAGFQILRNEIGTIRLNDDQEVHLIGLDDALLGEPDKDLTSQDAIAAYRILLIHEPDLVDELDLSEVDLVLAGHSHGGQVFIGGITTSMAKKYIRGFYTLSPSTQMYVNSGIGTSRLPVRIGVVPEIAVFDIDI